MAAPTGNLKLFVVWEKQARNAVDKHYPVKAAIAEARAAWALKARKNEYSNALREVIKSTTNARLCDKAVYNIPKRFTKRGKTPAQAYRDRWHTLRDTRRVWRVLRDDIQALEAEQDERDTHGNVIANARTLAYTAHLLQEATDRIAQLETDLRECRIGRLGYHVPVSADSEYSDSDSDDFSTSDEDADGNSEDSDGSSEDSDSSEKDSQSTEEESQNGEEQDGAASKPRFKIKIHPRKRKSGDSGDSASSKRSRTDSGARKSAGRRGTASDEGAASEDEDATGELEEEEEARSDEGVEDVGEEGMEEESDSETANYPSMSFEDFDARWDEFHELTKPESLDIEAWEEQYVRVRRIAKGLLEHEDWAIVPEITDDIDVVEHLDYLEAAVEVAWGEMEAREVLRGALREDKLKATKEIGFGKAEVRRGIPGDFIFEGKVGSGSEGIASSWVHKSSDDTIIDRVVIKDIYCSDDQWNQALYFVGDIQDRISREARMHQLVSDKDAEALHVVKYRESAVFRAQKMIRVYMEHCSFGEFWTVWDDIGKSEMEKGLFPFLSTAALWAIFECCAKVIHVMTFGCLPDEEEPEDWKSIVHRDIKAENVFMSSPHESRWRGTPTMKLGDFGFAAFASEHELLEDVVGTDGYIPPEIQGPDSMVTSAADIYTLGMVMIHLLTFDVDAQASYDLSSEEEEFLQITEGPAKEHYPDGLIGLINRCVQKWPEDRIGVIELCRRIEDEVEDFRGAELSEEDNARFPWQKQHYESRMARSP